MTSNNKIASITIDLRFEHPTDRTREGHLVNSVEAVTPWLLRAKQMGFNTVVLQTNTPIDIETGRIDLFAESDPGANKDKNVPRDFWKIAQQAKSLGLKVFVEPEIVNHLNDEPITSNTQFGPGWSWTTFFQQVSQYQAQLAAECQRLGLDGFYIGVLQHGLVGEQYRSGWQQVVDEVRKNFDGLLVHTAQFDSQSVVWDMVDVVSLWTNPYLSTAPITDYEQIYHEYFLPDEHGRISVSQAVTQNYQQYGKPIVIDSVTVHAGATSTGIEDDIPGKFFSGRSIDQYTPNYALQSARYKAAFELSSGALAHMIYGVGVDGFAPWQQATWIAQPNLSHPSAVWNRYARVGSDLAYAPTTMQAIAPVLTKGLAFSTLQYGDSTNNHMRGQYWDEVLRGFEGNDTLVGGLGNDTLWGGQGRDRFVFDTTPTTSNNDSIMDFDAGQDTIVLSRKVFQAFRKSGNHGPWNFTEGTRAQDRNDFLIWDSDSGTLYYDMNGSRSGGIKKIVDIELVGHQDLSWSNFEIVA